jgi:hypothetical protein
VCVCVYLCYIFISKLTQIVCKTLKKNYFHDFQYLFYKAENCSIFSTPLSAFGNNNGQNIDLCKVTIIIIITY